MKTMIVIEVHHVKEIPHLADMVAGRAYTIDGVRDAQGVSLPRFKVTDRDEHGFTSRELSLGAGEVFSG